MRKKLTYQVIRDTREQGGWIFNETDQCQGTVTETLKTGDYALKGFEGLFVIERKGSTSEFATNVVENRFERELDRLEAFMYPFVVLEFTMADLINFPTNSGIPRNRWGSLRLSPQFIVKRFNEIQLRYKAKFILAGSHGKEVASSLFKRVVELCSPTE